MFIFVSGDNASAHYTFVFFFFLAPLRPPSPSLHTMAADLSDIGTADLLAEVQRRLECQDKPEKRLILVGKGVGERSPIPAHTHTHTYTHAFDPRCACAALDGEGGGKGGRARRRGGGAQSDRAVVARPTPIPPPPPRSPLTRSPPPPFLSGHRPSRLR